MNKIVIHLFLLTSLSFANNVLVDESEALMWQDTSEVKNNLLNYNSALHYCNSLQLDGYHDWRLPSIDELRSISDDTKSNFALRLDFKNITREFYWSSTAGLSDTNYAYAIRYSDGDDGWYNKNTNSLVRCVRDMKKPLDFGALYQQILDNTMASFPKPVVQTELTKGQFEKTVDFEKRVAQVKKNNELALQKYKEEYQAFYPKAKKEVMQKVLEIYYGKPLISDLAYDADNELFGAKLTFQNNNQISHNIALKIAPNEAQNFYNDFANITPIALFDFDGGNVAFQTVKFHYKNKSYLALLSDQAIGKTNIQVAKLDSINANMQNLDTSINIYQNSGKSLDTSTLISMNDLDELLAKTKEAKADNKKWAFIIGLENYKYTDNVIYAKRSAETFAKVVQKTLGVPHANTYLLVNENATATEIKTKMKLLIRNVKEGDTIYFYYNGHGVPVVNKANEPYILSSDMMPDFVSEEEDFMMKQLYWHLSQSKANSVIAFVDSCFSGSTDGKSIQKGVAATRVVPKAIEFDKSKMVIFTAGKDTQYSNAYAQKAHRMFSYFVMEELLKGEKNLKELYGKVYKNTKETTKKNYGDMRIQEPTMDGNSELKL